MSKRKRKTVNPIPTLAVGDIVKHPKYGTGNIRRINPEPDYDFFYFAAFPKKGGGDGTKVWLPKVKTERSYAAITGDNPPETGA